MRLQAMRSLIVLVLLACRAASGATVADATVLIHNTGSNGRGCSGSGTCVGYSAAKGEVYVITCDHLWWEGVKTVTVVWPNGLTGNAKVFKRNRDEDLSAVIVSVPKAPVAWAKIANKEPKPGDKLWKIGYPLGKGPDARIGNVRVSHLNLMAVVPVCSGDSGGGLFNDSGELISIVSGYNGEPKYYENGVPVGGDDARGAGFHGLKRFADS